MCASTTSISVPETYASCNFELTAESTATNTAADDPTANKNGSTTIQYIAPQVTSESATIEERIAI